MVTVPAAKLKRAIADVLALTKSFEKDYGICFAHDDGTLSVHASRGIESVTRLVDAGGDDMGGVWVKAASLRRFYARLRGDVSISGAKAGALRFSGDGYQFTAGGALDGARFVRENAESLGGAVVDTVDFKRAVKRVGPMIGSSERYGLNGIHAQMADGTLRLVATNGSALRSVITQVDMSAHTAAFSAATARCLLPRTLVAVAARLPAEDVVTISIRQAPGGLAVFVEHPAMSYRCNVVMGEFPGWRQVLKQEQPKCSFRVVTPTLVAAMDDCRNMGRRNNDTKMVAELGIVTFSSSDLAGTTALASVSVDEMRGHITTGVDSHLLRNLLTAAPGLLQARFWHALDPMVYTAADYSGPVEDAPDLMVIMPVRVD